MQGEAEPEVKRLLVNCAIILNTASHLRWGSIHTTDHWQLAFFKKDTVVEVGDRVPVERHYHNRLKKVRFSDILPEEDFLERGNVYFAAPKLFLGNKVSYKTNLCIAFIIKALLRILKPVYEVAVIALQRPVAHSTLSKLSKYPALRCRT